MYILRYSTQSCEYIDVCEQKGLLETEMPSTGEIS